MKQTICSLKETGTSLPKNKSRSKYNKNTFSRDFDFYSFLKSSLDCGIISYDDVMESGKDTIMKTILDTVHHSKIGRRSDGRWGTYVADPTKPAGRREVKKDTLSDLYKFLISFYGLDAYGQPFKILTVEELYEEWVEYKKSFIGVKNTKKSLSPSTIKRYQNDYDKYVKDTSFAKKDIVSISPIVLETFFLEMIREHDMNDSCAKNILGYFNQVFFYAYKARYITSNPMDLVDKDRLLANCTLPPEKPDEDLAMTTDEFRELLKAVKKHEEKYPSYMPDYAVELAILTGMRRGELAALKKSCIDDMYLHIDYSEHRLDYKDRPSELVVGEPKNRKHRKIPISKEIRALLKRIEALGAANDEGYIFVDPEGNRYTAGKIGNAAYKRCLETGIKNGSIHRIRKTVSSILNTVIPRADVCSLLGHTEKVNEMHYDFSTASAQEKISALNYLSDTLKTSESA